MLNRMIVLIRRSLFGPMLRRRIRGGGTVRLLLTWIICLVLVRVDGTGLLVLISLRITLLLLIFVFYVLVCMRRFMCLILSTGSRLFFWSLGILLIGSGLFRRIPMVLLI